MTPLNLIICMQAGQSPLVSGFMSCPHTEVDYVDSAAFESFILYINPIKLIGLPSCTLVSSLQFSLVAYLGKVDICS